MVITDLQMVRTVHDSVSHVQVCMRRICGMFVLGVFRIDSTIVVRG